MINTRNTLGTSRHSDARALALGFVLVVAALALLARNGSAQTTPERFELFGTVVDASTGQTLRGAWVGLPGTRWGSLTNNEGRFRIPDVDTGRLTLKIEQLGYETLEWDGDVERDEMLRIELNAQPIVLEGLQVVTNRFRSRRNAVSTSVFAYDSGDLASSSARTALEFVRYSAGVTVVGCNGRRGSTCLVVRGRTVEPVIYIDEAPMLGGLDYLDSMYPWELYMVEIYGGGRHIRAYTPAFMERAAKQRLQPIALSF